MLWHTLTIIVGFWLLASVALFSSFEVVVLALAAFPSAVWELEVIVFLRWFNGCNLWDEGLDVVQIVQVESLVEWLHTASIFGHLSKLACL